MQIALFGGAFDPPHFGHLQVAAQLLAHQLADEVWYVPVGQHPFSKSLVATEKQRVAMLQLVLEPHTRLEMYELKSREISYAYYTLRGLTEQFPQHSFTWVVGSDNVASFAKWGFYRELLQEFKVWVYPRVGFERAPLLPGMEQLDGMPSVAISSTMVREAVKNNLPLTDLVPPAVTAYIAEHGLYR